MVWKGGMSFHGGLLGVMAAMALFARSRGRSFLQVMDLVAPCVPTGLAAGRIGNFINGELWGRAADPSLPWAMVFPQAGSSIAAPPVAAVPVPLEGLLLFVLLWLYAQQAARHRAGVAAPSCSATACCASWPSTSASPTASWACWRWA